MPENTVFLSPGVVKSTNREEISKDSKHLMVRRKKEKLYLADTGIFSFRTGAGLPATIGHQTNESRRILPLRAEPISRFTSTVSNGSGKVVAK
jgi:hypothetical protein